MIILKNVKALVEFLTEPMKQVTVIIYMNYKGNGIHDREDYDLCTTKERVEISHVIVPRLYSPEEVSGNFYDTAIACMTLKSDGEGGFTKEYQHFVKEGMKSEIRAYIDSWFH